MSTTQDRVHEVIEGIVQASAAAHDDPVKWPARMLREENIGPPFPAATSIMVRTYAIASERPALLHFDRCLMRFKGFDEQRRNPNVIWGVYGTEAMSLANALVAHDAARAQKRYFAVDLWYQVYRRSPREWSKPLTAEDIREHGYMDLSRLDSDYRMHVRSLFLERLREIDDPQVDELSLETSLPVLAARRPMLVHWFMDACRWVHAVQHTVFVGERMSLRIVTLRRQPTRYLHVAVSGAPQAQVVM